MCRGEREAKIRQQRGEGNGLRTAWGPRASDADAILPKERVQVKQGSRKERCRRKGKKRECRDRCGMDTGDAERNRGVTRRWGLGSEQHHKQCLVKVFGSHGLCNLLVSLPSPSGAGTNLKVGRHLSGAKVGVGAPVRRKVPDKKFFARAPSLFGSKSTIGRFGERFRDGQYSLASFLFAVLLLTVPPVPYMESAPLPPFLLSSLNDAQDI